MFELGCAYSGQILSYTKELDQAVRRIISHAVAPEGVVDIFAAAGLEDWTLRENVRANLRRLVRRVLRKHGYPPDKQEKATRTVLEQAEALSAGWAA